MGYKGDSLMDCGYFYAPYVPLDGEPHTTLLPYPEQDEDTSNEPEDVNWQEEGF